MKRVEDSVEDSVEDCVGSWQAAATACAEVVLGTGDVVPADLRLFEAKDFKVSEMALTGEMPKGTSRNPCTHTMTRIHTPIGTCIHTYRHTYRHTGMLYMVYSHICLQHIPAEAKLRTNAKHAEEITLYVNISE